jgi:hypothetical protein
MSDLAHTPILKNSMEVLEKVVAQTDKREVWFAFVVPAFFRFPVSRFKLS